MKGVGINTTNVHKTKKVLFTTKREFEEPDLLIDNQRSKISNDLQHLKIKLDRKMTWSKHIKRITQKVYRHMRY